ncbi:diguanylate cyclase [Pelomonas sp. V22]|uniref:ligand-binding sensor domain-containing diguanylate cyclase n=1 Tax=Pelomonas sp. V22 TaxID=2822139 RepID=UPI0024A91898|nr:ligand-binding sensor domain-containing diguanylate cyclase [Pelomonas sp. V22]MDI4634864.1 diguanylate cyclase [Pelomonas sp. V22]
MRLPSALAPFLLLLLAAGATPARGAATPNSLNEPRFESIGDAGSITDGIVNSLAQDGRGFVWVGGSAGLLRFDGYQLRPFPLAAGQAKSGALVRAILAARDGSLWVGRDGMGLGRLDPATGRWTLFSHDPANPEGPSAGSVRALIEDRRGQIWIATQGGGLDRYDPASRRFHHYRRADGSLPDDRVQSLRLDGRGELWVGTWNGLAHCREDRCEPRFGEAGSGLAGQLVSMLGHAGDGRLWAGTVDGGLFAIAADGQSGRWLERHGQGSVYAMEPRDEHTAWLARSGGLELRSLADGRLLQRLQRDVRKPWGLQNNEVVTLLRDRADGLWVGSIGGGLQRYSAVDAGLWVRRAEPDASSVLAEADVRSILVLQNGQVWLGTTKAGVAVLDEHLQLRGAIRPVADGQPGLTHGMVGAMAEDAAGRIWVASDGQLNLFDARQRLLRQWQVSPSRIRRLLAGRDGLLWIATQDGLYRLAGPQATPQRVLLQGGKPLFGNVNALAETPEGRLWVGSDAGLFSLARGAAALSPLGAGAEQAPPAPVLGLLLDGQQRLWVDTNGGLFQTAGADADAPRFEAIGRRLGLEAKEFGANLQIDAQGRLWTHRGYVDPQNGTHYLFTAADGVDIGTGWFRSHARLPDGQLLFGGSHGVLVVDPVRFKPWRYEPPVVPTELRIDGRPAPLPQDELRLLPGQRGFTLEFAALDFSSPTRNRYRFRLDGEDSDWTEAGASARVLSYGNLSPGNYRLHVQGSNRNGVWSSQELSLPVRVLPTWWQTWWARLLFGIGGLALVLSVIHARTRQLVRRQAELEAKVRERTQELEESSLTDPLTGLRNRRFLTQHIAADVSLAQRRFEEQARQGGPAPTDADLIFFLVDIDHFKQVNDRQGHAAGDAVIQQMRERLQPVFRDVDFLVRWGGEEFLIVARGTDRAHAAELAERARAAVAGKPFQIGEGRELACTCSLGFAAFPPDPRQPRAVDWDEAVKLADAGLYDAKSRGRNAWTGVLSMDLPQERPAQALLDAAGTHTLRS